MLRMNGFITYLCEAHMVTIDGNADVVFGWYTRLDCFTLDIWQQPFVSCLFELSAIFGSLEKTGSFEFNYYVVVAAIFLGALCVKVDSQSSFQTSHPSQPYFFFVFPWPITLCTNAVVSSLCCLCQGDISIVFSTICLAG